MHDCERGATARRRCHAIAREDLHVLGDHLGVLEMGLDPGNARDETVDIVLGKPASSRTSFAALT